MIKLSAPLKNEKGIAILVALSAVLIMTFLAVEVGYNSQVELATSVAQLDRLKAYYLAQSGINISLLRIKIFKVAAQKFGGALGKDKSMLDMIWSYPFVWPPQAPPDASSVTKSELKKAVAKSAIDGSFNAVIEGESSRIDLTDLVSPSKSLKEAANAQLVQLIQNRLNQDDDWARDHRSVRPQEIVNNITDWMDEDNTSLNGGDEGSMYNGKDAAKPPNRPMKTLLELHMVAGVTDDIYKILAPRITLYGLKGINVNAASKEVLQSIDSQITDKTADELIKRRNNPDLGPYTSTDDFNSFVKSQGANMEKFNKNPPIPLYFDSEFNFRIKSVGNHGRAQREIFAIVYDFDKVKEQLVAALPTPTPSPSPGQTAAPTPSPSPTAGASPTPSPTPSAKPIPKGPPSIVYWEEM